MPESAWTLGTLTGVAQVLADTQDGLTGSEIGRLLERLGMTDPGAGLTKWKRLEIAFVQRQNADGHPQRIITFIKHAMDPTNYVNRPDECGHLTWPHFGRCSSPILAPVGG